MVSSAPRVSPGLGGPASPYHISCLVGPKLKSSIAFSRLAKRASDTTVASLTSPSACLVFSGVTRLSVPCSSSRPHRPQFESDSSIATTCSNVVRWAGSCVEGCGAIEGATGAALGLCSWACAMLIGLASTDNPASATAPTATIAIPVDCVFMSRRLLAVDLEPSVDQRDTRVDDRMMQALLRGDKLHELIGALDVRRAVLDRARCGGRARQAHRRRRIFLKWHEIVRTRAELDAKVEHEVVDRS